MTALQTVLISVGTFVTLATIGIGVAWLLWTLAYRSARKERARERAEEVVRGGVDESR